MELARLRKGYTLRQLEKLTGIPHPTIKRVENGVIAVPGPTTLLALVDALDLDILDAAMRVEPYRTLCQRIVASYGARHTERKE